MKKLAVIFPGIGYHTDKPLLYYSKKIASDMGYEIIEVPYKGFPKKVKGSVEKMEQVFQIAMSQTESVLSQTEFDRYEDVLFISKSVGTAVAAAFAKKHSIKARHIYYTPVKESTSVLLCPGIVFHGTKDGWVETGYLKKVCEEKQLPLYITENGNHSLENGDTLEDLRNLLEVMKQTQDYIGQFPME